MGSPAADKAHPDEAAFFAKIIAEPDDDTHRLVYADWLEEHGLGERAEFIRLQIRIEREPSFAAPEVCPLRRRERELLNFRSQAWFDLAGDFSANMDWKFTRGFVAEVTCTAADWNAHGDAIRARHPVTKVWLIAIDGLLLGRNLLVQREGGVNGWWARITHPDEGAGGDRWPGVTFELPEA